MAKLSIGQATRPIAGNPSLTGFCFFVLAILLSHNTCAQKASKEIDAETLTIIREAANIKNLKTGALILLKDYRLTVDKKNRTTTTVRMLGKVFDKQAVNDYTQIPIPYNSYSEEAVLNYARVIYADGNTREVPGDAVQIKTSPEIRGGTQYSDSRYLSFALSGLEPGAVFEYQVTLSQKIPIIEGEWFENHWFAGMLRSLSPPYTPRIDPVLTSRYTLRVPKGTEFQYYFSRDSLEPVKTTVKDQDEYVWVFNNLPAITIEVSMPDLGKLNPILIISTLKDWSQVNRWAYDKLMPCVEVTQEIAGLSAELTSNAKTNNEKIKLISYYIQNNIQYVYADLNRGGYTPHRAGDVLKSRYGDCKDQTVLLISMLKAIGIEAFPALINPYPYDEYTIIPNINFSHLIAYIPLPGSDIWLDMTSVVTPYPKLAFPDQNRTALIINGTGGKLIKTPAYAAAANTSCFDLVTSFERSTGNVKVFISASGAPSDALKQAFLQSGKDNQEQYLRSLILSFVDKAVIDSIGISDVHNPDLNFQAWIKYHIDSIWKEGQQAFNFGSHAMIPLTFLANANESAFPARRYNDVEGAYSYSVSGSEIYVSPSRDLMPFLLPNNDSLKTDFFDYKRNFTKNGDTVKANWVLHVNQMNIPREQYDEYVSGHRKLRELAMWNVAYFEPFALSRDAFNNDSPQAILNFCRNMLKSDPGNILLQLLKGLAYEQLQMPDSSVIVFSELLEMDPDNKYAHISMVSPLLSMNKQDVAMAHIDEAIRLYPDFKEAYFIRASIWENIGMLEKALKDYESFITIEQNNGQVWQRKGYMLYHLKRYKEAVVAFRKAISIDPGDAWTHSRLADSYYELKQYEDAVASYQRAISSDPKESYNYGNLGWIYYLLENDQKCIEYSSKAVAIDPRAYYARFNIALAHLRSGNYEEALILYSQLAKEPGVKFDDRVGAISDLKALQSKGIRVTETSAILKMCFGL